MMKSSKLAKRVIIAAALAGAFLFMASVFSPYRTKAADQFQGAPVITPVPNTFSTNPHEGLQSLGTIEDDRYMIEMYATEGGPRYSVYDAATGKELSTLLSAEQVDQKFPEINLPSMDFDTPNNLMLAEPRGTEFE